MINSNKGILSFITIVMFCLLGVSLYKVDTVNEPLSPFMFFLIILPILLLLIVLFRKDEDEPDALLS